MLAGGFIFISLLASITNAAPPSITPLSSSQVSSYKSFTHFASTAHCSPNATMNWSCNGTSFLLVFLKLVGPSIICIVLTIADCKANSDFIPVASGGNGGSVQFCKRCSLNFCDLEWIMKTYTIYVEGYVGFSPSQSTIIVAHQGTDFSQMLVLILIQNQ